VSDERTILTLAAAVSCAVAGGALFAFSAFVMSALRRLPAAQGIAAMQSINIQAVTPAFMAGFFGPAALCALLAIDSLRSPDRPGAGYVLAGTLLYLAGTIAVTIAFNVPRNNALAALDPARSESQAYWTYYVRTWTRWNHVRTAAAIAASALVFIGLGVRWVAPAGR